VQRLAATRPKVRCRTLALPNEHGAWAFLLDPALLGLGVAPSAAGPAPVGAGPGALLTPHPLGLALAGVRRRKRFPRTVPALGLVGAYGALAAVLLMAGFLAGAMALAAGRAWLLALGMWLVVAAARLGAPPQLAVLPSVLLLARAAAGMWVGVPVLPAKRVGMLELGYSLVTVAAVLAGAWLGW